MGRGCGQIFRRKDPRLAVAGVQQSRPMQRCSRKVSAKYMPLYVAEFQFRYSDRFNADIFGTAPALRRGRKAHHRLIAGNPLIDRTT
jgi:hypothetical protein